MNKINVNIYGRDYTFASEKSKEFMVQVANFVDDEIKTISSQNTTSSKVDILILACNNIAEKYFELQNKNLLDDTSQKTLNETIQSKNEEINTLQEKLKSVQDKLQQYESSEINGSSLKSQIEKIQSNYEEKLSFSNEKLKELQDINDNFQNQFYDLQLKLAQTEEELQNLQNKNGVK